MVVQWVVVQLAVQMLFSRMEPVLLDSQDCWTQACCSVPDCVCGHWCLVVQHEFPSMCSLRVPVLKNVPCTCLIRFDKNLSAVVLMRDVRRTTYLSSSCSFYGPSAVWYRHKVDRGIGNPLAWLNQVLGCIHIDTSTSTGTCIRVPVNMSLPVFQWWPFTLTQVLYEYELPVNVTRSSSFCTGHIFIQPVRYKQRKICINFIYTRHGAHFTS